MRIGVVYVVKTSCHWGTIAQLWGMGMREVGARCPGNKSLMKWDGDGWPWLKTRGPGEEEGGGTGRRPPVPGLVMLK